MLLNILFLPEACSHVMTLCMVLEKVSKLLPQATVLVGTNSRELSWEVEYKAEESDFLSWEKEKKISINATLNTKHKALWAM